MSDYLPILFEAVILLVIMFFMEFLNKKATRNITKLFSNPKLVKEQHDTFILVKYSFTWNGKDDKDSDITQIIQKQERKLFIGKVILILLAVATFSLIFLRTGYSLESTLDNDKFLISILEVVVFILPFSRIIKAWEVTYKEMLFVKLKTNYSNNSVLYRLFTYMDELKEEEFVAFRKEVSQNIFINNFLIGVLKKESLFLSQEELKQNILIKNDFLNEEDILLEYFSNKSAYSNSMSKQYFYYRTN